MAGHPWSGWAWPEYQRAILALAQRHQVIGHGHPRSIETLAPAYRRAGIEVVRSFDEVCRRADVYVCDNSSTLFEFAATGRPVVVLNSVRWIRGQGPGLRFWDAAGVGVNVNHPSELEAAVDRAMEHWGPDVRARENALDVVYSHRTGATARAVDAIRSVVRVEVAA
jgi:UDP-N-acetylglucosamine:LPS N-acetylglucosamine transferase